LNSVLFPVLKNLKHCHTPLWTYNDHGKNFEYKNRCGTWADFILRDRAGKTLVLTNPVGADLGEHLQGHT